MPPADNRRSLLRRTIAIAAGGILSALSLLSAPPLDAATFPYLYHGVVAGEGRQPTPEETGAALAQVLTRLTGIEKPAEDPRLADLLTRSTQLVSEYDLLPAGAAGVPRFRIGFHRHELTRHLRLQNLSIWDSNHPLLLLFVVQTDGAHPIHILSNGDDSPRARALRVGVESLQYSKGLMLMLPIRDYDEQDLALRRILQRRYRQAARSLKERYQVEAVVLIHLERIGTGDWYAESRFFGDTIEGKLPTGTSRDIDLIVRDSVSRIGDYYWALNARKPRLARGLQLVVENVGSYGDLDRLLAVLAEALPVEQLPRLSRMTARQIEFNFQSEYPVTRIRQLLSGQRALELVDRRPVPGAVTQIYARLMPPPAPIEDTAELLSPDSPR